MNKPIAKSELVLFVLWFICFILMLILNIFMSLNIHWISIAVFAAPLLFFIFITWLRLTNRIKSTISSVLLAILSIVFAVLMFFNMIFMGFYDAGIGTTNLINYHKLLLFKKQNLVSHFPEKIPKTASEVRFFELPGLMEGGTSIFLRYKTSVDELNSLNEKYSKNAKVILKSGKYNWNDDHSIENKDFYIPKIFDAAVGYSEIPNDYDIIIIDSKPYQTNDWNHGYSYGLAISKQKLEVLFWSVQW